MFLTNSRIFPYSAMIKVYKFKKYRTRILASCQRKFTLGWYFSINPIRSKMLGKIAVIKDMASETYAL